MKNDDTATIITDEMLSAYLDRELPPAAQAIVEQTIARNPELAARLDAMRALDTRLRAAYSDIDDEPMPAAVLKLLEPPVSISRTATVVSLRPGARRWLPGAGVAAIAASVLVALVVVFEGAEEGSFAGLAVEGRVATASPLFSALEQTPSGVAIDAGADLTITPLLTFAATDKGYCREFSLSGADRSVQGLACRDAQGWITRKLAPVAAPDHTAGYAPATYDSGQDYERVLRGLMQSEALGPQQEQQLLQHQWVPRSEAAPRRESPGKP